jgi:hypothetical protein
MTCDNAVENDIIKRMRIFVDEDFKCDSSKGFVATIIMNSWVFLKEKLNLILSCFSLLF